MTITTDKILVLDNYDLFTYNLIHILKELTNGGNVDVFRNDKISLTKWKSTTKLYSSPDLRSRRSRNSETADCPLWCNEKHLWRLSRCQPLPKFMAVNCSI